jgi:hypothetical protein
VLIFDGSHFPCLEVIDNILVSNGELAKLLVVENRSRLI